MFQEERYSKIYEILKERESVTIHYLTKNLYVSVATIRRDLEKMEEKGMLKRVWGGAILPAVNKDIPSFVRQKSNNEKKEKIAAVASRLLLSSSSVYLDSSTTCLPLVPYMKELKNMTAITSSLKMSKLLSEGTSATIFILGGEVYENYIMTGYAAIQNARLFHPDIFFCSCSGISSEAGVTSREIKVAELSREMMKNAKKKVLLCDTSKVGVITIFHLADLSDFDYIIMDEVPDDQELVKALGKKLITTPEEMEEAIRNEK